MSKELVTIEEFLQLTLLTERDLLDMLGRGELKTGTGANGELLIDIGGVSEASLAGRAKSNPLGIREADVELYEEIIASEVLGAMENLLDESLELALKWQNQSKDEEESAAE